MRSVSLHVVTHFVSCAQKNGFIREIQHVQCVERVYVSRELSNKKR
jgi:hypothetical protein